MCGILFHVGVGVGVGVGNCSHTDYVIQQAHTLEHRGPDNFKMIKRRQFHLGFHRLSIMDPSLQAMQPFEQSDGLLCMCNGEIYNYQTLITKFNLKPETNNDCEIIPLLYRQMVHRESDIPAFIQELHGMFAIVLVDLKQGTTLIIRDHMGIIPLYWSHDEETLWVASEQKAIPSNAKAITRIFPPRSYVVVHKTSLSLRMQCKPWYDLERFQPARYNSLNLEPLYQQIRHTFLEVMKTHIKCDVPFGCLLSGGLDSSIIAALASKLCKSKKKQLHTFTIGIEGDSDDSDDSDDRPYAKLMANYLHSTHHDLSFTLEEGLRAIPHVIRSIETFDVTTVRRSTAQWILAQKIHEQGFKMCLSGEGSDEAWSGYLYNHHCPSEKELDREAKIKCNELHLYDCLRTNKTMAAFAIECRVPFLDRKILELAFKTPIAVRMPSFYHDTHGKCMEKGVLRTAFQNILPPEICWRRKAQMSDAVGSAWIRGIKKHCASLGQTEEQFYREIYVSLGYEVSTVPQGVNSVACSSSVGASWCPTTIARDPSGRHLQSFLDRQSL